MRTVVTTPTSISEIRLATYGRDFGLTSWVSTEEADAIPGLLNLSAGFAGARNWLRFGSLWTLRGKSLRLLYHWT